MSEKTTKLESIASMNIGRSYAGTFVIDDVLYITGGYDSSRNVTSTCESFDMDTAVFSSISNMQKARAEHATFVYADKGYIAGGHVGSTYTNTVENTIKIWMYGHMCQICL